MFFIYFSCTTICLSLLRCSFKSCLHSLLIELLLLMMKLNNTKHAGLGFLFPPACLYTVNLGMVVQAQYRFRVQAVKGRTSIHKVIMLQNWSLILNQDFHNYTQNSIILKFEEEKYWNRLYNKLYADLDPLCSFKHFHSDPNIYLNLKMLYF